MFHYFEVDSPFAKIPSLPDGPLINMTKERIIEEIVSSLGADLSVFSAASKAAHEAATHSECLPDNKYDTTALEASYIAQGQANRAQEIRVALEIYRTLTLHDFDGNMPIRLTALVTLVSEDGSVKRVFLGPQSGGMKIVVDDVEMVVITPVSPLGSRLLGLRSGDEVRVGEDASAMLFTIAEVC